MSIFDIIIAGTVVAIMGGFVGLVTTRVAATLISLKWADQANKEQFIAVSTLLVTFLGALGGGCAGCLGFVSGLLYLPIELASIVVGSVAIWGLVVAVLRGVKAGFKLSDVIVEVVVG